MLEPVVGKVGGKLKKMISMTEKITTIMFAVHPTQLGSWMKRPGGRTSADRFRSIRRRAGMENESI